MYGAGSFVGLELNLNSSSWFSAACVRSERWFMMLLNGVDCERDDDSVEMRSMLNEYNCNATLVKFEY